MKLRERSKWADKAYRTAGFLGTAGNSTNRTDSGKEARPRASWMDATYEVFDGENARLSSLRRNNKD